MDKFVITGGAALHGEIPTGGSKNSALPALAAALLTEEPVTLRRIPRVRDIRTMQRLLVDIGSKAEVDGDAVRLHTPQVVCPEAPYELVKTMRASSLVLGPLVARTGQSRVSMPGGCAIGARPIDLHLKGLEQLGAELCFPGFAGGGVAGFGERDAELLCDQADGFGEGDVFDFLDEAEDVAGNAAAEAVIELARGVDGK
jgi:UDP-N-acetylglucosamine 1-carboxyvinyltransferase